MKNKSLRGAAADSLFLAAAKIITMLTNILSTMILSHNLSLEAYGTYSQGNLVISIGVSLSILGLSDAVNYFYNGKDEQERKKYVNTVFQIEITLGLIVGILILVFRKAICSYFQNTQLTVLFIYIAFRPLLDNMVNTLRVLQVSIGRAKVMAIRNLLMSLSKVILVLFTVFLTNKITTIFLGFLITDIISVVYYWVSFSKRSVSINPFKGVTKLIPAVLSYSLPMAIYTLTQTLLKDIDKLIIGRFEGTDAMAIYSNCSYALPFDVISNAFLVVMVPIMTYYISKSEYEKAQGVFSEYLRIGYMTTCVFAAAVFIVASEVVSILFGEQYMQGLTVFKLYLLVDAVKFANLSIVLSAKGQTKKLMVISMVSLSANFVLNILFYYLIGFIGPAVASVIVSLMTTAILCHHSSRALCTAFSKLINAKEILLIAFEMLCLSGPCLLLRNFLRESECMHILTVVAVGGTYIGLLFVINRKRFFGALKNINSYKVKQP